MWWLGLIVGAVLILAAILYSLAAVTASCSDDDDVWLGY